MTVASLSQDLYRFAIELRQLAYTMPGGPPHTPERADGPPRQATDRQGASWNSQDVVCGRAPGHRGLSRSSHRRSLAIRSTVWF